MQINRKLFLCVSLLAFVTPLAQASTLASETAGVVSSQTSDYYGESFTTAAGGPDNNITFNFLTPPGAAYALGTGFLFTQAYIGMPPGLNSSDPGFLGSAVASGGLYSFAAALTLSGGTQYFFYEDALIPVAAITGGAPYAGGDLFFTGSSSTAFLEATGDSANFMVTGTPVATTTPEPSSIIFVGTGILGLAGVTRRRFSRV